MPRKLITGKRVFSHAREAKPKRVYPELEYVPDEETIPVTQQKWRIPKETLAIQILKAGRPMVAHPRYKTHEEKKAIQDIVRGSISLEGGVAGIYPLEWVEHCIEFCQKQWQEGHPMPLENLIKYINNKEKKNDWIAQWACRNHRTIIIAKQE